jgi:hypothetical protein
VYCLGYALRVPIEGYCFYVSDVLLVTYLQAAFCLSDVRPVASVICDFIVAAFVMVWGGAVSLSFREVFYRIGASECHSYVISLTFFVALGMRSEGKAPKNRKPTVGLYFML